MGTRIFKFKKNPKYLHQRSEGLTKRGAARQERLMLGPQKKKSSRIENDDYILAAILTKNLTGG